VPAASCVGLAATCGSTGSSPCCESPLVPTGTFYRGNDAAGAGAGAHPRQRMESRVEHKPAGDHRGARLAALEPGLCDLDDHAGRSSACRSSKRFAFCAWDGGYLPTEADYAASGGSEQRAYPWSSPADSVTIGPTYASYSCLGDGLAGCTTTDCIPVGSHPAGNGRWGQSDLGGNVHEWILDLADFPGTYPNPCVDCAELAPQKLSHRARWHPGRQRDHAPRRRPARPQSGDALGHGHALRARTVMWRSGPPATLTCPLAAPCESQGGRPHPTRSPVASSL
jgi:sulfatase modifying factor 1